jgi:hypothetical protein
MFRFWTGRSSIRGSMWMIVTLLSVSLFAIVPTSPIRGDDSPALKTPKTILIIRHAEKLSGEAASDGLAPKGEERAKELFRLFDKSDARPEPFPKPDFIFAAKATRNSRRSKLTVAPLAEKLKLRVNDGYGKDSPELLAKELTTNAKFAGKTILICWQHGTLPQLAAALGATDAPSQWHAEQFDRVWRLDYDRDGKVKFSVRPQRLLEGDSTK